MNTPDQLNAAIRSSLSPSEVGALREALTLPVAQALLKLSRAMPGVTLAEMVPIILNVANAQVNPQSMGNALAQGVPVRPGDGGDGREGSTVPAY